MVGYHIWGTLAIILFHSCGLMKGQPITAPVEVGALQAIRKSLKDPMDNLRSWNRGDPCMLNWTGVLCFNTTEEDGYLHVWELQLLNKNLSGSLAPELGQLLHMEILNFMWNKISGVIPKEIGNMISLRLLLLNGNELSGPLPPHIGNLSNLERIQIDENHISGPLPASFANLKKAKHFHMNNNTISGQIPPELSQLPNLMYLLLDNNNLNGYPPEELSSMPNLNILYGDLRRMLPYKWSQMFLRNSSNNLRQLDNNNFNGASIPSSFGNMKKLLKLSLRNCSLQGPVPDLSRVPRLGYLDLSWNQLSGPIPTGKLSINITTIDLSNNQLNGSIPSSFSGFPFLQILSLENNSIGGSVPDAIWQNITLGAKRSLILNFKNNNLTNSSHALHLPTNVSLMLYGNPVCAEANQLNISQFCGAQSQWHAPGSSASVKNNCLAQSCPLKSFYEYNHAHPEKCFCAAPIRIGYRLKSPVFSDFYPYTNTFKVYLTSGLNLKLYQLDIDSFFWEEGPRLRMHLKFFPENSTRFNTNVISQMRSMFTRWIIPERDIFGPYELLNFTLLGQYGEVIQQAGPSSQSKGKIAGIIVGTIAGAVTLSAIVSFIILRSKTKYRTVSKKRHLSNVQIKINGVKDFTFQELSLATNKFSDSTLVGKGGYGKVYKGVLADGTAVAIKRAEEGSLQGSKEFFTEIELLSRLHHRNLVSLIGYCDEEYEQMLVYEFVPNGTLRHHLSANSEGPLSFSIRLRIALGSARGILYLHTEANPPIIHRDIKACNILLDSKFTAKVADFGLSRLAPVPDVEDSGHSHISTMVKGTPGYVDPEYFLTHQLTDKSDVYSLGVVLLELVTGMQPISHGKNIVREVSVAYQSGLMSSVIDSHMGSYPSECVERFTSLAFRCCLDERDARPSMAEVVRELETIYEMAPKSDMVPSICMATDTSNVKCTLSSSMPNSDPMPSISPR